MFLENCPPTPPQTSHFAQSEKEVLMLGLESLANFFKLHEGWLRSFNHHRCRRSYCYCYY